MEIGTTLVVILVGVIVGLVVIGFIFNKKQLSTAFEVAQLESKSILEDARKEADQIVRDAIKESKSETRQKRKALEDEAKKRRAEISKLENKLKQREKTIETKLENFTARENELLVLEKKLAQEERKHHRIVAECELAVEKNQRMLEKIANMSVEQAKEELLKSLKEAAHKDAKKIIREIEDEARKEGEQKAQSILSLAVQRTAGDYVSESTISVVSLPSDEMKGRIIGREGRNIRAIEQATGVDLIIDDTPEAVIISCFNPIRREIAKITLERLIADGRIHPARIEETAQRVEAEFDSIIKDHGEEAAFDVGITDLPMELLMGLGRLRYRISGLQSVLQHSVETAHICGIIAGELKLNVKKAKRAGLLHDIGKSVGQEVEGDHATIGANLCEKANESKDIVEAIRLHHHENLQEAGPLAVVVSTANKLSGSRPGARREVVESYVKRLDDMEKIANGFKGIEKAYVLQAGREIRVLVSPDGGIGDQDVIDLSGDIASKLRQEVNFPGQVKVTVLRESKFTEYAK